MKKTIFTVLVFGAFCTADSFATDTIIKVNGNDTGRVFEGIGAVSAGASTRNLVDYPDPQRSEVLDYLFKPNFGAALQHLKVEIGGGENSTCGSEPSHAITREELNNPRARGYEFWLMSEARRRNPRILLDCLPWSYPGWISSRFSQDSADWYVSFLNVAKRNYGLDLDWAGASQNESGTDLDWVVKILRPTLDAKGYNKVQLQGPDDSQNLWNIFNDFDKNPAAANVIRAVTYHYPSNWLPNIEDDSRAASATAKASGKPLWSSEDFSHSGKTWDKALELAQLINKNYIRDRITKTEVWCPVDGIYPGVIYAGVGLMQSNSPWSAHYSVWPAIWTTAHTTQFARPGWRYLNGACGKLDARTWTGTYVTLRDPATRDWSMIVCTRDPQTIRVEVAPDLDRSVLHIWRSKEAEQFVEMPDIIPVEGEFTLTLDKSSVYSITTTTGQRKGVAPVPPAAKPFPLPYRENFNSYAAGKTPTFFSDQKGTFETVVRSGHDMCLQQIVPEQGIWWLTRKFQIPSTVFGDDAWSDYKVQADVLVAAGSAEVGGRYSDPGQLGCGLALSRDGTWTLLDRGRTLAAGKSKGFDGSAWHTLKVTFSGERVLAEIDGNAVADVSITGGKGIHHGLAFLASSYSPNRFDNILVTP